MSEIRKLIRDSKVAILLSDSKCYGWYTDEFEYTQSHLELLYCPPLVEVVSNSNYTQQDIAKALIEFGCTFDWKECDPDDFENWLQSEDDYDRENELLREILIVYNDNNWLTA